MLQPLGLAATLTDDGLVISADMTVLAREGIGTDHWINIDDVQAKSLSRKLLQSINQSNRYVETPLEDVVRNLSEKLEIPIILNREALGNCGIDHDTPVTASSYIGMSWASFIKLILANTSPELKYVNRGSYLEITSGEDSPLDQLVRIYWLDGTGLPQRNIDSLIKTLKVTIRPASWDDAGGRGSISTMNHDRRAALCISASTYVHEDIERYLDACRKVCRDTRNTTIDLNIGNPPFPHANDPFSRK